MEATAPYTLEIVDDDYPESPREWDNLGNMVCFHRRYALGDEAAKVEQKLINSGARTVVTVDGEEYCISEVLEDAHLFRSWVENSKEVAVCLPLYLYDHSVLSMSTSLYGNGWQYPQWDGGLVGFLFVTKAELRDNYGVKRVTQKLIDRATEVLRCEVKTYDQYLHGDVYGFRVLDAEGKVVDSCYGFYGTESAQEEGTSMLNYFMNEYNKEHFGVVADE